MIDRAVHIPMIRIELRTRKDFTPFYTGVDLRPETAERIAADLVARWGGYATFIPHEGPSWTLASKVADAKRDAEQTARRAVMRWRAKAPAIVAKILTKYHSAASACRALGIADWRVLYQYRVKGRVPSPARRAVLLAEYEKIVTET